VRVGAGGFHADIRRHLGNLENDLLDDLACIENRVKALSAKIEAIANEDEAMCWLLTNPLIGALGVMACVAAAWPGLGPAEHSTFGPQTLLGVSKRGNGYLHRLIISV
jgi:transposase